MPEKRSPLHPKALTLSDLEAKTRGITVVICTYRSTPTRPLERMDAATFVGVVKLYASGVKAPYPGKFVVLRSVPDPLKRVEHKRLGFSHLAIDIDSGDLPHLRPLHKVMKGFAFSPHHLGLLPLNNEGTRWPHRCVINVEDM